AAQRAKLEAYAQLYDLELVAVIEDAGVSAKSLNRPGLQEALAMLKTGKAQGLLRKGKRGQVRLFSTVRCMARTSVKKTERLNNLTWSLCSSPCASIHLPDPLPPNSLSTPRSFWLNSAGFSSIG